jgi:hypothetical protein
MASIEDVSAGAPERSAEGLATRERDTGRAILLEVEVRELVRAIGPYGVLSHGALARACGARRWRSGHFDRALSAAVATGRLRRLPFDYYGSRTSATAGERAAGARRA